MDAETKRMFLLMIVETLKSNPDWMLDVLTSIQFGMSEALIEERHTSTHLASALVLLVQKYGTKLNEYELRAIYNGLVSLKKFYDTAPVQKDIDALIEKVKL